MEESRAEVRVEKNGRVYQLLLPADCSIGEAYDGCYSLLSRILEIAQEAAEKARPQKVE